MSSALCAQDLLKRFRNAPVLDGLNLDVPEASVFGLIGPNGAGKTTTIKILMNIIKATSGRAEVLGVDSRHLGPSDLEHIGYVSENQEMPEWTTVEYFLAYLALARPPSSSPRMTWPTSKASPATSAILTVDVCNSPRR